MNELLNEVRENLRRVRPVAWVGFGVSGSFLGLIVMFVAGSALVDVGGWEGVGLTLAWLVPLAGLAALGLLRPAAAVPTLAALSLLPLGFGVWSLVDFDGVRDWEDGVGPVSLVLLAMVVAGLVALGLARPTAAGAMILVATIGPVLLAMVGAGGEWHVPLSVSLVTVPFVVTGALYLAAGTQGPVAARSRQQLPTPTG